jgi:hypothetical protein
MDNERRVPARPAPRSSPPAPPDSILEYADLMHRAIGSSGVPDHLHTHFRKLAHAHRHGPHLVESLRANTCSSI